LVILGGTIAVLKFTQKPDAAPEETSRTESPAQPVVFADFNAEDLRSVHVKNKLDDYNIEKNNAFFVKEISVPVPYSESLFEDMANSVSSIKAYETVELGARDLDKYGLLTPKAEVEAVFTGGSVAFCIGDNAPIGMSVYFRLKDSSDVYAVSSSFLSVFEKERYYYIERKVAPDYDSANAPVINRVLIKRKDLEQPIEIEALPEVPLEETRTFNTHRMFSPFSLELDPTRSQNVIFGFFGLTAKEAVYAGLEELDYEKTSINAPTCYVEIESDGKVYSLTIGAARVEADENGDNKVTGWYGMCGEVADVLYVFAPESLPWLYAEPEDLMSQAFLTPYVYSLKELVVEAGDKKLTFDISGNADEHTVLANNVKVDEDRYFSRFYMFIIGVKGEWIFMEPENETELLGRATFRYNDENRPDDVIEYYAAADRKSVIRVNGKNVFKCRDIYTERLAENISAFLSGGEIVENW